jgi:hypothetical protein
MVIAMLLLPPSGAVAQMEMDGHGPDAWQVTGVASNDTLNVRTGPGASHLAIGTFAHNATGLQMITCVPFLTQETSWNLTASQRAGLPARWCLMESRDGVTRGWVSANYLAEQ